MLRLTFLLCAALFLTLLIGGQDYGQLRPGLVAAQHDAQAEKERAAALALAEAAPQPVSDLVVAAFTPEPAAQVPESFPSPAKPLVEEVPAELATPAADKLEQALAEAVGEDLIEPEAIRENVWYITASSVNVREGPGKDYAVLDKLTRGDSATLIWTDDTGWSRIRIEGDGVEGYVSTDFLSALAP
jgi:uncharacterized protein YgiM (DUF1202 family)